MEQYIIFGVVSLHVIFWSFMLLGIIYFGVKAYKRRKEEKFEKRDN